MTYAVTYTLALSDTGSCARGGPGHAVATVTSPSHWQAAAGGAMSSFIMIQVAATVPLALAVGTGTTGSAIRSPLPK